MRRVFAVLAVAVAALTVSAAASASPPRSHSTVNRHHTTYLQPLYPPIGGRVS